MSSFQRRMRKFLVLFFIVSVGAMTTLAQTGSASISKDLARETHKFYFPSGSYIDSIAMIKAMPKLAEQVVSVYHDEILVILSAMNEGSLKTSSLIL